MPWMCVLASQRAFKWLRAVSVVPGQVVGARNRRFHRQLHGIVGGLIAWFEITAWIAEIESVWGKRLCMAEICRKSPVERGSCGDEPHDIMNLREGLAARCEIALDRLFRRLLRVVHDCFVNDDSVLQGLLSVNEIALCTHEPFLGAGEMARLHTATCLRAALSRNATTARHADC